MNIKNLLIVSALTLPYIANAEYIMKISMDGQSIIFV